MIRKTIIILGSKLPLSLKIIFFYFLKFRNLPNLKNPKKLSEKIQKRKFNILSVYSELADKIKAKEFALNQEPRVKTAPNIAVCNSLEEINFNMLPEAFVIKTNFGSGPEHLELIHSKNICDWTEITKKFDNAMKSDFYIGSLLGETQYDMIDRKILIEEMLNSSDGDIPDYKFHMFNNGENGFVQVDFSRFVSHKRNIYDLNFNKLPCKLIYENGEFELPSKENLKKLLSCAKKLAEKFDYVRVDLYLISDCVYFGEMTFTPGNGFEKFEPSSYDNIFGEYWRD